MSTWPTPTPFVRAHDFPGRKVHLAADSKKSVELDLDHLAVNNVCLYGIRGEGGLATHRAMVFMTDKRVDATKVRTLTVAMR